MSGRASTTHFGWRTKTLDTNERPARPSWAQRIARARALASRYPSSSVLLDFYASLAGEQQRLSLLLPDADQQEAARHFFPQLLDFLSRCPNPEIAAQARALRSQEPASWFLLLQDAETSFFAVAFLQPYSESLDPPCPSCRKHPQVSVLRQAADGLARTLACSLCHREWPCERILCPSCQERAFDRLPVFTAESFPHLRVEACDSCKNYFIGCDVTKDAEAIPLIEDIAAIPLHLWAQQQGYRHFHPNLFGL